MQRRKPVTLQKVAPIRSAFAVKLLLTIVSKLAIAAATTKPDFPCRVLVIDPGGNWSMIDSRPITAEIGSELLIPLAATNPNRA